MAAWSAQDLLFLARECRYWDQHHQVSISDSSKLITWSSQNKPERKAHIHTEQWRPELMGYVFFVELINVPLFSTCAAAPYIRVFLVWRTAVLLSIFSRQNGTNDAKRYLHACFYCQWDCNMQDQPIHSVAVGRTRRRENPKYYRADLTTLCMRSHALNPYKV